MHGAAALRARLDRRIRNFWITSKRCPQASHWYSYRGIAQSITAALLAGSGRAVEQSPLSSPSISWRCSQNGAVPLAEQRVVKRAQRKRLALLLLVVAAQLQQHQLADACTPDRSDRTCRARPRGARSASSMNASSRKNRTPCSTDISSVCSLIPTMKRARRISASASCPSLTP